MKIKDYIDRSLGIWDSQRQYNYIDSGKTIYCKNNSIVTRLDLKSDKIKDTIDYFGLIKDPLDAFNVNWETYDELGLVSKGDMSFVVSDCYFYRSRGYLNSSPIATYYKMDNNKLCLFSSYNNKSIEEEIQFISLDNLIRSRRTVVTEDNKVTLVGQYCETKFRI